MSFDYSYGINENGVVAILVMYLVMVLLFGGLGIVTYVLRSLGVYTIARRRELNHPWMAWVPMLNYWILGSISDQYQYVAKGKNKNKRKWMIVLAIAMVVIYIAFWIVYIVLMAGLFSGIVGHFDDSQMLDTLLGPLIAMLVLCLPMMGLSIALMIIRYMALYDLYNSADPKNSVMYLVLSILVSITEPFFIFFSRKKDLGMPPRRPRVQEYIPQQPAYQPQQPAYQSAAPVYQPETPVDEPAAEPEAVADEPVEPAVQEPIIPDTATAEEPVTEEEAPVAEPEQPIILGAAPAGEPAAEPEQPGAEVVDPWDAE